MRHAVTVALLLLGVSTASPNTGTSANRISSALSPFSASARITILSKPCNGSSRQPIKVMPPAQVNLAVMYANGPYTANDRNLHGFTTFRQTAPPGKLVVTPTTTKRFF